MRTASKILYGLGTAFGVIIGLFGLLTLLLTLDPSFMKENPEIAESLFAGDIETTKAVLLLLGAFLAIRGILSIVLAIFSLVKIAKKPEQLYPHTISLLGGIFTLNFIVSLGGLTGLLYRD